jgi:hypothetical protein
MTVRPPHRWIAPLLALAVGCAADPGAAGKTRWPGDPAQSGADGEAASSGGGAADDTADGGTAEGAEEDADDANLSDTGAAPGGAEDSGEGGPADSGAAAPAEGAGCGGLVLDGLRAEDEDGDGQWSAGEVLWVQATIENTAADDFFDYPGATLRVETGDVLVPEPTAWVYSLEAGGRALLQWWAIGAPDAAGDVLLRVEVVTGACGRAPEPCPSAAPAELHLRLSPR